MSIFSAVGSSAAAEDIKNFCETLLETEYKDDENVREAIAKIIEYAKGIKKAADSGWY